MGVSDRIEAFITELLKTESSDEWLELRRNELAAVFGCAPSQINYVMATRFSPQQGYIVESRRGGGGYIRIRRVSAEKNAAAQVIAEIGESIDFRTANARLSYLVQAGAIDKQCAKIISAAVSDKSLTVDQPERDKLRANILRNTLMRIAVI